MLMVFMTLFFFVIFWYFFKYVSSVKTEIVLYTVWSVPHIVCVQMHTEMCVYACVCVCGWSDTWGGGGKVSPCVLPAGLFDSNMSGCY